MMPQAVIVESGVVGGEFIFEMHDTYGIPIEITLLNLADRRLIPDCPGLFREMVDHGWNRERAAERLHAAVEEAYPYWGTDRERFIAWWDSR